MRRDQRHDDDEEEEDADAMGMVTYKLTRAYEHEDCGGTTIISGGDYAHICDPFWPCTSTYCCGCGEFVSLREVRWMDSGETVYRYRRRMRRETPGFLMAWRLGVGFLVGSALGAVAALIVVILGRLPQKAIAPTIVVGTIGGAIIIYAVGTFLFNRVYGIDYRRIR